MSRHSAIIIFNTLVFLMSGSSALAGNRDLSLRMTASPTTASSGQALTYSLCVSNKGNLTANNVVVSNPLPANAQLLAAPSDCVLKTQAKGQNKVLTCKTNHLPAKSSLGWSFAVLPGTANELLNTASVKFNGADANPVNNNASLTTPILPGDYSQLSPDSYKLAGKPKNAPIDVNASITAPGKTPIYPIAADVARDCAPVSSTTEQQAIANAHKQLAFAVLDSIKQNGAIAYYSNVFSSIDTLQNLTLLVAGANGDTLQARLKDTRTNHNRNRLSPAMNAFALDMVKRNQSAQLKQDVALWGQGRSAAYKGGKYQFSAPFLNSLVRNHGAAMAEADFTDTNARNRSGEAINQWLTANSHAAIVGISAPLSKQTRMTAISSTSLDGAWQIPSAGNVTEQRFLNLDDSQVLTPMLSFSGEIPYTDGDGYQAFDLPLADSTLALTVLMPEYGRFSEFQSAFTAERLNSLLAAMQPKTLTLYLPETQIRNGDFSVGEVQQALFKNTWQVELEQLPDFSRVNGKGFLFMGSFSSKTVVSLDETGIHAYSATQSTVEATQNEPETVWSGGYGSSDSSFSAQFSSLGFSCAEVSHWDPALALSRPFIFALRDRNSGAVLFIGQLTQIKGTAAPADWTTSNCPTFIRNSVSYQLAE